MQPRALPAIAGLSVELGIATQRHDGLPKIVHAMATAAGNGAAAEEVDLLRVHVDTALHHVLAQYPRVEAILLTADVSCLKALLEVRNEIVAAGHTPSAQVPTTDDLNVAIEKLLAHQLRRRNR
ncbi:DUF2694 family protein [Mycobacterium tuberculosis]|uniref:DUF2694 family protein n=1 Tax=Mycobacterium tuberculosis TaxID=1773 RepID=UPI0039C5EE93